VGSIFHGGSLWRLKDAERLYNWNHKNGDFSTIVATDFSAQGKWAITADIHTLVLWDMESGQAQRYWIAPGEILDAKLSPSGQLALLGLSDHTAVVFDIQKGGVKRTLQHSNRVRSVSYSSDGKYALTGSEDTTAILWDLNSGKKVYTFRHENEVQLVALSPNGKLALSVSKYDKAMLWNTTTGREVGVIPIKDEYLKRGESLTAAAFDNKGKTLLTGGTNQHVTLWSVKTLSPIQQWKLPKRDRWKPTSASVLALSFKEKKGRYVAVASNGFAHQLNKNKTVQK